MPSLGLAPQPGDRASGDVSARDLKPAERQGQGLGADPACDIEHADRIGPRDAELGPDELLQRGVTRAATPGRVQRDPRARAALNVGATSRRRNAARPAWQPPLDLLE